MRFKMDSRKFAQPTIHRDIGSAHIEYLTLFCSFNIRTYSIHLSLQHSSFNFCVTGSEYVEGDHQYASIIFVIFAMAIFGTQRNFDFNDIESKTAG